MTTAAPASPGRAWLLLLGLIVVWGSHWVVVKVGLETLPPFAYGVLRLVGGAVFLAVLMAATGRLRPARRADLPIIVSYGLLAVALGIAMMNLALPFVPAGRSAILAYTLPLWVVPVLALMARTLPTRAEVGGLVLGLAGLAMLLNPVAIDWSSLDVLIGSLLLLLGALGGAIALVHVRTHRWAGTPSETQVWQLLVALLPMLVLMLVLEGPQLGSVSLDVATLLAVFYSGVLATAFGFWASQTIVRSLGPLTSSIGYLGAPVVGVLAGVIVLGEAVTVLDVAGIAMTAAGIVTVLLAQAGATGRRRAESRAVPRSRDRAAVDVMLPDGAEWREPRGS
jgi:drug/metabolite transporter (DMT)-like permease